VGGYYKKLQGGKTQAVVMNLKKGRRVREEKAKGGNQNCVMGYGQGEKKSRGKSGSEGEGG